MGQSGPRKAVTLLMGGPGSGKGTLGLHIARELGCDTCITMSDALRRRQQATPATGAASSDDTLDSSAKLVGDALVCSAFQDILNTLDSGASTNVMVDGFPRSQEQVQHQPLSVAETCTFLANYVPSKTGRPNNAVHPTCAPA